MDELLPAEKRRHKPASPLYLQTTLPSTPTTKYTYILLLGEVHLIWSECATRHSVGQIIRAGQRSVANATICVSWGEMDLCLCNTVTGSSDIDQIQVVFELRIPAPKGKKEKQNKIQICSYRFSAQTQVKMMFYYSLPNLKMPPFLEAKMKKHYTALKCSYSHFYT